MKRILLFVLTNVMVVAVLGIVASVLGFNRYLTANGLDLGALLGFALYTMIASSEWCALARLLMVVRFL